MQDIYDFPQGINLKLFFSLVLWLRSNCQEFLANNSIDSGTVDEKEMRL